jgi:phytoene dehydrogenase-like protein
MDEADYVIVGSGINALVAAAMLGKKGRRVVVLERNDRIGGAIRTDEATEPGFIHDVMATTFVLFLLSPAHQALGKDLAARGLAFANTDTPTAVVMPDGRSVVFTTDRVRNIATLEALAAGDGAAFARTMDGVGRDAPFLFSLLGGSLWSAGMAQTVLREAWRRGPRALAAWFGEALDSARSHLETTYASEEARALWAPWVLHTGLGPESAYSGQMARVIAFAIEAAGCPVVVGGAANALRAFERLIVDTGGTIHVNADVARIVRGPGDRAAGVQLADGTRIAATRGVICSVTPGQLYGRLLEGDPLPDDVAEGLRTHRLGKANMQIHFALDRPPRWTAGEALSKVALIHLTPGLDGVSRAANEAERGLLPAEPTVCVGQPTALDPTRAPDGKAILWLQLPECPRVIKGDAAGEIEAPDGTWTEAVRERYADRVQAMLERHIEGFGDSVIARRSYSPADLAAMNVNLEQGDPYGGYCGIDQFFLWRPFKRSVNHRTHVPGLWHIGASTHPGPGLGGGSGYLLGSRLR